MLPRRSVWSFSLTCLIGALSIPKASSQTFANQSSPQDLMQAAEDVYIYAYPLVLMGITRQTMTSADSRDQSSLRAPANEFIHVSQFPDPGRRDVVSPNADTLYSTAWLDLSHGPVLLSVPDTEGRYYLLQCLDAWTNVFASLGKRTTGTAAKTFAIAGPGWHGDLPPNVQAIRSPTNMVWIIGRTQTNGQSDYAAVHAIQNQFKLSPLPQEEEPLRLGMRREAPPSPDIAPVTRVADMPAEAFFHFFARAMAGNPPAPADLAIAPKLMTLGVVGGQDYSFKNISSAGQDAIARGVELAKQKIKDAATQNSFAVDSQGWSIYYDLGNYGTNYLLRAAIALVALGANLPADSIYPMARTDSQGQALSGAYRYRLHFAKDQLPPVTAFWSLTLYDNDQFFVPNPLQRYALGDRDPLHFNDDGSLDIYIQHADPGGEQTVNWLPAPEEGFNLMMRLYGPKEEVLARRWVPPPLERLDN